MKSFITAGFVAVTAMVALSAGAEARGNFCQVYPDDPACVDAGGGYRPPPPPDDTYDPPPPPRRYQKPPPDTGYDPGYDQGYDQGYEPGYDRTSRPPRHMRRMGSCQYVGAELRRYGYRAIRAVDCSGQNYKYRAWRGGQRYLIKVDRRTGRIFYALGF
jgi:hypothetical protein